VSGSEFLFVFAAKAFGFFRIRISNTEIYCIVYNVFRLETINDVWQQFTQCLISALGIITFQPVFQGKQEWRFKIIDEDDIEK
jgi:hypothetical protein